MKRTLNRLFPVLCIGLMMPILLNACSSKSHVNIRETETVREPLNREEELGIQVLSIRESAAGHMLDLRYRVKDPEKASLVLSAQMKPYLIDQGSGTRLSVPNMPKMGSLRQKSRQPEADRVYFILFANPGKLVKPGNKVTVVFGDVSIENLVVE